MERPDVLVLGGGGLLGEAWLRALLAGLEAETGWDLRACDAFVGTSAGSIVAAAIAAGRRPEAVRGVVESWERAAAEGTGHGADRDAAATAAAQRDADGSTPAGGQRVPGGSGPAPAGLLTAAARRALAEGLDLAAPIVHVAAAGLEPAGAALRAAVLRRGPRPTREIPRLRRALDRLGGSFDGRLRVTAVDLRTGRRVIFGAPGAPDAGVTDAVLASCAVPWVFEPVTIGGREYVDGGAWSAANVDAAPVREGARVLCLNPTGSPRLTRDPFGAMRAFSGAGAAAEALVLRRRGARVRIVAPDAATVEAIGPSLFDPRRRANVEAAAYRQGRALASRA